jgi:hypothetical protein
MIKNVVVFLKPIFLDKPPSSLKDPNVSPRAKKWKRNKVGAHSLTRSILGVGGHVGAPR